MLDTNTVETNMEHFKDRNRTAGASQIAQWVNLHSTEASGPSSIPKSSGWQERPDTCQLHSDVQTQVMACMPQMYIHARVYTQNNNNKLKNKEPLHIRTCMSIYTQ